MDANHKDPLVKHKNIEWLKNKFTVLCSSSQFCGLCLDDSRDLNSVNLEFLISKQTELISLVDVLYYVFNDDIENIMSSIYICDVCTEKTIQSYLFIDNTKKMLKTIKNCVTDIYNKLECTTNVNAEYVLLFKNDTEFYKEIDNIIATSEIVPADKPIVINQPTNQREKPVTEEKENDFFNTTVNNNDDIDINLPIANLLHRTPNISLDEGKIVVKPIKCLIDGVPKYIKYECKQCPNIFITSSALKKHEMASHGIKVLVCDLCDFTCIEQHLLNLHYDNLHSMVHCIYCDIKLIKKDLMSHFKQSHGDLIYPCDYCELVYHSRQSYNFHLKKIHFKELEQWECKCLKEYVSGIVFKNFKCKFSCSDCVLTSCIHRKYLIDFSSQISNASKAKCLECDFETDKKQRLLTHVNKVHLNHRPFECNYCGLQFYSKTGVKRHIIHFHMANNVCEYRDEEFKNKNVLTTHVKSCKVVNRKC